VPSEKRTRQRAAREARLAAEAQARKRRKQIRNGIIIAVVAAAVIGIAFVISSRGNKHGSRSNTTTTTTTSGAHSTNATLQAQANAAAVKAGCPASTKTVVNHQHYSSPPAMTIDTSKTYTATVATTTGTFVITLDAKTAPTTVNNFVFLADKGFYHCVIFHRVIPQFVDQTGDPTGLGTGGPGYSLPAENPPAAAAGTPQYPLGSVAMATSSQGVSGSQFFIVAGAQGESLPATYPLFGTVTSGMNVVSTINQQGSASGVPPDVTQRILSVTISSS
jgi:cyclophilin family peptidyl-prolyl cis-trans isomerase